MPTSSRPPLEGGSSYTHPFVFSQATHPKPAPDLTQAIPQFVGVEHYGGQEAPPGARGVVAEFLSRMHPSGGIPVPHPGHGITPATMTTTTSPKNLAAPTFMGGGMMGSVRAPPPNLSIKDRRSETQAAAAAAANKSKSTAAASGTTTKAKGKGKAAAKSAEDKPSPSRSDASKTPQPARSQPSGSKPTLTAIPTDETLEDDEDKRRQFLERNRVAACKSRAKKKEWQEQLEVRAQELTSHNNDLQSLVSVMRDEIVSLRAMVAQHAACQCGSLKGFVEGGGLGLPSGFGAWGMGAAAPLGAAAEFLAQQQQQQAAMAAALAQSQQQSQVANTPASSSSMSATPQNGPASPVAGSASVPASRPLPLPALPLPARPAPTQLGSGAGIKLTATGPTPAKANPNSNPRMSAADFAKALGSLPVPARPTSAPPTTPPVDVKPGDGYFAAAAAVRA